MIQSHWGMITKLTCPGLVAMLRSGCAAGWFSMENLPLYTGKPEKTKRDLRSEVQMALLSFLWCKSLKIKQRQQVLTQASFLFRGTDITPFSVSRTEGKLRVVFVLNQHQPWFSFFQLGWHRCYCDSLPPELRDRRVAKILPASSVSKPSQHGTYSRDSTPSPARHKLFPLLEQEPGWPLECQESTSTPKHCEFSFLFLPGSLPEQHHLGGDALIPEDSVVNGVCRFWRKSLYFRTHSFGPACLFESRADRMSCLGDLRLWQVRRAWEEEERGPKGSTSQAKNSQPGAPLLPVPVTSSHRESFWKGPPPPAPSLCSFPPFFQCVCDASSFEWQAFSELG